MRLVRRALLSLAVGVTAFGAAGWALRPRATWTTTVPSEYCSFIGGEHDLSDEEPVWLDQAYGELAAVDPRNGNVLRLFGGSKQDVKRSAYLPLPDGRLLAEATSRAGEQILELLDIGQANPVTSTTFSAEEAWQTAGAAPQAWRIREMDDERFVFERRQLERDAKTHVLDLTSVVESTTPGYFAYSAKRDILALSERICKTGKAPYGIQLREAATGRLIKSLKLDVPENRKGHGPQGVEFLPSGRLLRFSLPTPDSTAEHSFVLNLSDGRIRPIDPPTPPPDATGDLDVAFTGTGDDHLVMTLAQLDPPAAWASLVEPSDPVPKWCRLPIQLFIYETFISSSRESNKRTLSGVRSWRVPARPQLIVGGLTQPLSASVPETILGLLQPTKEAVDYVWTYRWLEWPSRSWRPIGCTENVADIQVRPSAFLTLVNTDRESSILQSWPLPPRDPRPPALAIATLCTAGMWWLCAWRYRRRTRLAQMGAA
jgi:hypothetical protein